MSVPELSMTRAGRYTRTQLTQELRNALLQPVGSIETAVLFRFLRSTQGIGVRPVLVLTGEDLAQRLGGGGYW